MPTMLWFKRLQQRLELNNSSTERSVKQFSQTSETLRVDPSHSEPSRLSVLDGLRGIAIILVLLTHFNGWFPAPPFQVGPLSIDFKPLISNGGYGVDLFFFLSGFCLFYPYIRAFIAGSSPPTLLHFMYRRAAKIAPSYVLAIGIFTFTGYATYHSVQDAVVQILRHLMFIHTWFPDSWGSISGVFWSLGVEVQFYILFPLIVGMMLRRPLLTFILALLCASLSRLFLPFPFSGMEGFTGRQLPSEIDLFVSGMFAATLFYAPFVRRYAADKQFLWAWTLLAAAGVLLFILAEELGYHMSGSDRMYRYAVPLLDVAFIAVTLGTSFGFRLWRLLFANPLLTFFALISYNLYLYHVTFRDEFRNWGGTLYSVLFFSILLASILTFCMERPLLRLAARLYDRHEARETPDLAGRQTLRSNDLQNKAR